MDRLYVYENTVCIRVIDFLEEGLSDSDCIEYAIAYAKAHYIPVVLFDSKDWIIDRAILFYSGVTFIVDGVTLKQADGVFDNIFRSEGFMIDPKEPYGYPLDIHIVENFRLIGKNHAVIEGPEIQPKLINMDTGEMEEPYGDIWGWRGFSVYITCCRNFEFSGFIVRKTRNWAITLERAHDACLRDLEVYSTCKNGDGINLRNGCSRIVIENIKGETSDDFIALNNCSMYYPHPYRTWKTYFYPNVASNIFMERGETLEDQHIHDIIINNVSGSSAVMFLPRNGHKIFCVWVSNVNDGTAYFKRRNIAYMVGAYYDTGYGDLNYDVCLSDIYIDHVETNASQSSVLFREHVKNLVLTNIRQNLKDGTVLTAEDEDEIVIRDSSSVSGIMRKSAKNWINPLWQS